MNFTSRWFVHSRNSVSCGDILWNTTRCMLDFPLLRHATFRTRQQHDASFAASAHLPPRSHEQDPRLVFSHQRSSLLLAESEVQSTDANMSRCTGLSVFHQDRRHRTRRRSRPGRRRHPTSSFTPQTKVSSFLPARAPTSVIGRYSALLFGSVAKRRAQETGRTAVAEIDQQQDQQQVHHRY